MMTDNCSFNPPWYLRNPHLQTLFAATLRPRPQVSLKRQRLTLPDGDFIDLDWGPSFAAAPLVLILHGLEGSSHSRYARGLLAALAERRINAVVMHFRGCSDELNLKPYSYCAGCSSDLDWLVLRLRRQYRHVPLSAVGYSIGGNVLLKWLGETAAEAQLDSAVAVSVPYRLGDCADRLQHGFSRLYRYVLIHSLRRRLQQRARRMTLPIDTKGISMFSSFREFDDRVTAPLHGYLNVQHYYDEASAIAWVDKITRPTLLIHAADDPFMWPSTAPHKNQLPKSVELQLTQHGGHVGFISADPAQRYWLEHRIPQWLEKSWAAETVPASRGDIAISCGFRG